MFVADTRIARTGDRVVVHGAVAVRCARSVGQRPARARAILVLGQPIFTGGAGLKGYIADWGLPDFDQYRDLVRCLASTPHDIVVLTGDVHFGRVASCTAPGGRQIVELIASPFALVDGFARGQWKPAPAMYPAVPVPGDPGSPTTTRRISQIANHAMTVGFNAAGQEIGMNARSWPIGVGQPAVGTQVMSTKLQ